MLLCLARLYGVGQPHKAMWIAGMHQPRFCSFEPGQLQPLEELDIEPPSTMTRCTIQDMRASFASGDSPR